MGAFDPLIPWPNRSREDNKAPVEPAPQPSPDNRVPIGPTDI